MDAINYLYSTYTDPVNKHVYDLEDLGPIKRGGDLIMAFSTGMGHFKEITTDDRPAKLSDYDGQLIYMITSLDPIYKLEHCLAYHYTNFLASDHPEKAVFTTHLRYVIMPQLKTSSKEAADLMDIWLNKQEKFMHIQQLQQKRQLLKRAYDAALASASASPLSVWINTEGIAAEMQYDLDTTRRIVRELVSDQLATSILGMSKFAITDAGRRFLEQENNQVNSNSYTPIHFQVGDNSTVQFQSGTHHSVQKLEIHEMDAEVILTFLKEIKEGIDIIKQHISEENLGVLIADVNYIENALLRPTKDKVVIKSLLRGIVDIIKSVPGNVIANIITSGLPPVSL